MKSDIFLVRHVSENKANNVSFIRNVNLIKKNCFYSDGKASLRIQEFEFLGSNFLAITLFEA